MPLSEKGMKQMERVSEYILELFQNSSTFYGSKRSNPAATSVIPTNPPFPHSGGFAEAKEKGGGGNLKEGGLLKAVYCSDLKRAIKSAELIASPHSLNPIISPSLRERNFGIWEGMSFDEIREKYPGEFESWAGNPLKYSPMGGESTLEVRERVINAFENIIGNHNEERIAIVAHGGVNRIVLCHILGIPLENIFRIEQDYGALNIIEFWDKYPVVKLINGITNG